MQPASNSSLISALSARQPAADCCSIAAALEAGLRAAVAQSVAALQRAEEEGTWEGCQAALDELFGSALPMCEVICGSIEAVARQQLQQQQQHVAWAGSKEELERLQLQLFALLTSCLKVAGLAAKLSAASTDVLQRIPYVVLRARRALASRAGSSSSSSVSTCSFEWSSRVPDAMWPLLLGKGLLVAGQLQQLLQEEAARERSEATNAAHTECYDGGSSSSSRSSSSNSSREAAIPGRSMALQMLLRCYSDAVKHIMQQVPLLHLPGDRTCSGSALMDTTAEPATAAAAVRASRRKALAAVGVKKASNPLRLKLLAQGKALQRSLVLQRWVLLARIAQRTHAVHEHAAFGNRLCGPLISFGASVVAAVPGRLCCNNGGCVRLERLTEGQLVQHRHTNCSRYVYIRPALHEPTSNAAGSLSELAVATHLPVVQQHGRKLCAPGHSSVSVDSSWVCTAMRHSSPHVVPYMSCYNMYLRCPWKLCQSMACCACRPSRLVTYIALCGVAHRVTLRPAAVVADCRCRSAAYCSKECQIAAWKQHKHICKAVEHHVKAMADVVFSSYERHA
jgi:hypothetical protein